jgi:hypothetical protein
MLLKRRDFLTSGFVLGSLTLTGRRSWARDDPKPSATSIADLWDDLQKEEEKASRALLKLSVRPKEAVPLIATELKPLRVDADWLAVRLERLSSKEVEVWKPAFEELEYFDPRLAKPLETLMEEVKANPARSRLVEVLSERDGDSLKGKNVEFSKFGGKDGEPFMFNFRADNGSWWAEPSIEKINSYHWGNMKRKWTRAVRAIALLEHFGTSEAIAVLKTMTSGDPDAQPTKAAKQALDRLTGKER